MMGQPEGGFPPELQKLILKDKQPITCRPGELLPPEDFDHIKEGLIKYFDLEGTPQEVISYAIYPKVFEDYLNAQKKEGSFRYMMSKKIAAEKGYDCPYCGDFDCVIVPTMAAGNLMHKAMIICGGTKMAGVVVGAKVPVVLTSRGASTEEKFVSLALASLIS